MDPLHVTDFARMDAHVASAERALAAYRVNITRDPSAHEDAEPLAPHRNVAGQTTYRALAALSPLPHEAAHRDALLRWIAELTLARVERDRFVELAQAAVAPNGTFTLRAARKVGFREAWREAILAPTVTEARAWLSAAAECGPEIAAAARERAAVRVEVAARLGLPSPAPIPLPEPGAPAHGRVQSLARAVLVATDDLAAHVLREALTREPAATDALFVVRLALGRDAPEGWPARLSPRWLSDLFPELAKGLRIALGPLPVAIGGASFARALGAYGHALAVAGVARSLPFALARDPQFVRAHRFAAVFGALPTSEAFQRRALAVSPGAARDQARVLARTALFEMRVSAARAVLTDPLAPPRRDAFEELTARLFGTPLPGALAGAWPLPSAAADEPARFLGQATALPLARELVERFDEDWFKNPRASAFLRAIASAPAREELVLASDVDIARALARSFEGTLA